MIPKWIREQPYFVKWRYPPGALVRVTVKNMWRNGGNERTFDTEEPTVDTYAVVGERVLFVKYPQGIALFKMKDLISISRISKKEEFTARLKGLV